jgi:hypothetical protein
MGEQVRGRERLRLRLRLRPLLRPGCWQWRCPGCCAGPAAAPSARRRKARTFSGSSREGTPGRDSWPRSRSVRARSSTRAPSRVTTRACVIHGAPAPACTSCCSVGSGSVVFLGGGGSKGAAGRCPEQSRCAAGLRAGAGAPGSQAASTASQAALDRCPALACCSSFSRHHDRASIAQAAARAAMPRRAQPPAWPASLALQPGLHLHPHLQ